MFTRSPAVSVSEANSDGKPEPEVNTIEPVITAIPANGKPLLAWVGAHEADTANEADPSSEPVIPEDTFRDPVITVLPLTSRVAFKEPVFAIPTLLPVIAKSGEPDAFANKNKDCWVTPGWKNAVLLPMNKFPPVLYTYASLPLPKEYPTGVLVPLIPMSIKLDDGVPLLAYATISVDADIPELRFCAYNSM
jgi:hypothetical protein